MKATFRKRSQTIGGTRDRVFWHRRATRGSSSRVGVRKIRRQSRDSSEGNYEGAGSAGNRLDARCQSRNRGFVLLSV